MHIKYSTKSTFGQDQRYTTRSKGNYMLKNIQQQLDTAYSPFTIVPCYMSVRQRQCQADSNCIRVGRLEDTTRTSSDYIVTSH